MEPDKLSEIAITSKRRDEEKVSSVDGKSLVNTQGYADLSGVGAHRHGNHSVRQDTNKQTVSALWEEDPNPPVPGKDEGSRVFEERD